MRRRWSQIVLSLLFLSILFSCLIPETQCDDERACLSPFVCQGGRCICPPGTERCGPREKSVCADLQTDAKHCGTCETSCNGKICSKGKCCPEGQTYCKQIGCVNLDISTRSCGSCGTRCDEKKQACIQCKDVGGATGSCLPCVPGQNCKSSCRDNCPGNLKLCKTIKKCNSSSSCSSDCKTGDKECDILKCIDLQNTTTHCGACGNSCGKGPKGEVITCKDGKCQCDAVGMTLCGNTCVNIKTDPNHCGACNNKCFNGVCSGGQCCLPKQILCNGQCVDFQKDPNHCGGCGKKCPSAQACILSNCKECSSASDCPSGKACRDKKCADTCEAGTQCTKGIDCEGTSPNKTCKCGANCGWLVTVGKALFKVEGKKLVLGKDENLYVGVNVLSRSIEDKAPELSFGTMPVLPPTDDNNKNGVVVKMNSLGQFVWRNAVTSSGDSPIGALTHADGKTYIGGTFTQSAGFQDKTGSLKTPKETSASFSAVLSSTGQFTQKNIIKDGIELNKVEVTGNAVLDDKGSYCTLMRMNGKKEVSLTIYCQKASGEYLTDYKFKGPNGPAKTIMSTRIISGKSGELFLAGNCDEKLDLGALGVLICGGNGLSSFFVKFVLENGKLEPKWFTQHKTFLARELAIAYDKDATPPTLYITGSGNGGQGIKLKGNKAHTVQFGQSGGIFVAQMDANTGDYLWAVTPEKVTSETSISPTDIAVDSRGVYVLGNFTGEVRFKNTKTIQTKSSKSDEDTDAFILFLKKTQTASSSMDFFAQRVLITGDKLEQAHQLVIAKDGSVYVTGTFDSKNATFGSSTAEAKGDLDLFVWKVPRP